MRRTIALSDDGGHIHFISAYFEPRGGGRAALGEARARRALEEALELAGMAHLDAEGRLVSGLHAAEILRSEASGRDLLAIGAHGGTRLGGLLAVAAPRRGGREETPLLVARRSADGEDFPQSILLATDGSPSSWPAARLALDLALEKGSELRVAYVPDESHPAHHPAVLDQLQMIAEGSGARPPLHDRPGPAAERIASAAQSLQCSVIVIGRHGLDRSGPLGSVSARVAQRARCSVLIVPG